MSLLSKLTARKHSPIETREDYQQCMSNASKGDIIDLNRFIDDISNIPSELFYDAVRLLLSYLREPETPSLPMDVYIELGAASLLGMAKLAARDNPTDDIKQKHVERIKYEHIEYIRHNWYNSQTLSYTLNIISTVRKEGDSERTAECFSATILLLSIVCGKYPGKINTSGVMLQPSVC